MKTLPTMPTMPTMPNTHPHVMSSANSASCCAGRITSCWDRVALQLPCLDGCVTAKPSIQGTRCDTVCPLLADTQRHAHSGAFRHTGRYTYHERNGLFKPTPRKWIVLLQVQTQGHTPSAFSCLLGRKRALGTLATNARHQRTPL